MLIIDKSLVNGAERQYLYDCHGWLTEIRNIPNMFVTVPGLTSAFYAEATGIAEPQISYDYPGSYTEKILYADGTTPRYDGTASAHVSSLGGRYDFTYDNHDRLAAAAYSSSVRSENYSTQYSYNALGAPVSLRRMGRNVGISTSGGGFGVLDDLTYSWDGAQLQTVTATASGSDYYGRTGFPLSATGGSADFWFDDAGQMTMDSSRGIIDLNYNRQGLPVQVTFSDGSRVIYTYSYAGELRSMKSYYKTLLTSRREYCGDFIFENDTISMVNFPGGYFDSKGNPFYRHTDWQGNVTMVTNSSGKIAQRTGYYPYGEPWSEPSGQPYLYGGKERLREGGLNEYDFGARRYNSALALWTTPDPLASKFGNINPYTFCCGNPIKYVDRDGRDAMVQIQGNNITITVNVILEGAKVTNELVKIFLNDIQKKWCSIKKYKYEGVEYNINWNVNVRKLKEGEEKDYNGVNNYLEVTDDKKSYVIGTNHGIIRYKSYRGYSLVDDCPIGHEFGHFLGLSEKYNTDNKSPDYHLPISDEWIGNVMAEPTYITTSADEKNMDIMLKPILNKHNYGNKFGPFINTDKYKSKPLPHWAPSFYFINNDNREPKI